MEELRYNFDATDSAILVCRGNHEKESPCNYSSLSPSEILQYLNLYRAEALESKALRARLAEVEAQMDGLRALVLAVKSKSHHIEIDDVGGKNWFDLRREALGEKA